MQTLSRGLLPYVDYTCAECRSDEYRCAECRYAECRYAECR